MSHSQWLDQRKRQRAVPAAGTYIVYGTDKVPMRSEYSQHFSTGVGEDFAERARKLTEQKEGERACACWCAALEARCSLGPAAGSHGPHAAQHHNRAGQRAQLVGDHQCAGTCHRVAACTTDTDAGGRWIRAPCTCRHRG